MGNQHDVDSLLPQSVAVDPVRSLLAAAGPRTHNGALLATQANGAGHWLLDVDAVRVVVCEGDQLFRKLRCSVFVQ